MNTKLLIIIGIIAIVGTITILALEENDGSLTTKEINELERQELITMTCPEIVNRNTIGGQYKSKENREFAREKVGACSDVEEYLAALGSCENINERYHSGEPYLFEDHKTMSENHLAKCDEFGYDVTNLKEINNQCNARSYYYELPLSFIEFGNGTHYINNETCDWSDLRHPNVEPTSPNEVIKSITLYDVPYHELIENEQEYVGNMLHYYGKILDVDEYVHAGATAKIAVTPGAGWVDFIELTYHDLKLKNDTFKEVWGIYKGINNGTGLPMLQVFIIK